MALPLVGQHDAAQVGVTAKAHAEKVPDLALVEIGGRPFGGNAGYFWIEATDQDAKPKALLEAVGQDVVGHLKARLAGIPVHAGDVRQKVIAGLLQGPADRADIVALDPQGQFATIEAGIRNARGLGGNQGGYGVVLGMSLENSIFLVQGVHYRSALSADQSS